jgi:hypothetical protein
MKTNGVHTFLLLLGTLLGLSGCAPTQYLQLRPVSGEVGDYQGRSVTKITADSVEVVASFEREDMEYLALDVELKNHADQPLDVDPSNFRITLLDADKQPLVQPGVVDFKQAADPEYEAGKMPTKIQREEARLKRNRIINTALFVAIIAADIASSSSSNRNSRDFGRAINRQNNLAVAFNALQVKRVIDHTSFENKMQRFQFEEYRWRELAMKRTTLQPGQTVRGFVYLPKVKGSTYLNLTYPTPSGTLQLLFEQSLTRVRPR